jgi:ubiquinone/menaquinone biosynthesis C-methylase UbiE
MPAILDKLRSLWQSRWRGSRSEMGLGYWQNRARTYGARAVISLGHPEHEFEAVTLGQRRQILPYLVRCLNGRERVVLDFGCGPGRFTPLLAETISGRAIGVDPIRTLLDLAPRTPAVEYLLSDGRRIPLPDASVDVAWVCLVLGGLPEVSLPESGAELDRVLRTGGLLFVIENTSERADSPHWAYRSIATYQQVLAFAPLAHLHDYHDLGERISIMAGRKAPPSLEASDVATRPE